MCVSLSHVTFVDKSNQLQPSDTPYDDDDDDEERHSKKTFHINTQRVDHKTVL